MSIDFKGLLSITLFHLSKMRLHSRLMPAVLVSVLCLVAPVTAADQDFEHFVRRDGDTLKDGDDVLRFISVNIDLAVRARHLELIPGRLAH